MSLLLEWGKALTNVISIANMLELFTVSANKELM